MFDGEDLKYEKRKKLQHEQMRFVPRVNSLHTSLTNTPTHNHTHTHTHTHTHIHTHAHTHTHTHAHTHTITYTLTHTLTHNHTLTITHTHSLTITHTLTHTHTYTHSHTHTHTDREWTAAQIAEKERLQSEQQHADRLYDLKTCELDQRAVDLACADTETRKNITVATKEYNLALVGLCSL